MVRRRWDAADGRRAAAAFKCTRGHPPPNLLHDYIMGAVASRKIGVDDYDDDEDDLQINICEGGVCGFL